MEAVDAAREHGFAAVSSNDHFVFARPWLEGPTALAAVLARAGDMEVATTVALPVLRGPVALAKALAALDVLSGGRLTAAVGPGSSRRDYELAGIPFEERWRRFDEAVAALRYLLRAEAMPSGRFYSLGEAPSNPRRPKLAAFPSGSEAGAPRQGCVGSQDSPTGGLPPPTTQPLISLPPPVPRSRMSWRPKGGKRPRFPMPLPPCGLG